jgi:pyruvate formate lyase activating enzyme
MKIGGYLRTSLIEWPGKIAAVIFTPGCNFRCPFCHNSNLVLPEEIENLALIEKNQVLADLKKRIKWIDGVVISGGEPTLQSDLGEFLKKVKKAGLEVMIETNGCLPGALQRLIKEELVDFVAMDYKIALGDYAGLVNYQGSGPGKTLRDKIKQSIHTILESGLDYEFRTTVIPTIHNRKALLKMARELKKLGSQFQIPRSGFNWTFQSFRPKNCLDPKFEEIEAYNLDQMQAFLKGVQTVISGVRLRGDS